jgi:hypothetical protein
MKIAVFRWTVFTRKHGYCAGDNEKGVEKWWNFPLKTGEGLT